MPDSPLLNTINSIVIFSYLYFNIWITAPGYPSNGTLGKKEMIIPSLNVSFNTILNTDIYVALEQELRLPSISEYIRLTRDYSGPSERVRLATCRLTCDYPTKEFHHYYQPTYPPTYLIIFLNFHCPPTLLCNSRLDLPIKKQNVCVSSKLVIFPQILIQCKLRVFE